MSLFPYIVKLYKFLARSQMRSFLKKEVAVLPISGRVLIVGAGGDCESVIRQAGKSNLLQFETIDIDPNRKPTIIGDVHTFSFTKNFFDAIIVSEVIEHFKDPRIGVCNLYRSLKSGGRIIASVPFIFPTHDLPADYFRYTSSGLKELFDNFNDLKILKKNNWPEAILVLLSRLIFSPRKRTVCIGTLFLFLYFILLPLLRLIGYLFPDDSITSGYLINAVKL